MIAIAGYIRVPAEMRSALQPAINPYVAACRAEPGCAAFTLAFDALDPEYLQVFELWRAEADLSAHVASDHETTWRQECRRLAAGEHALTRYDILAATAV